MTREPLDPATYAEAHNVLEYARVRGLDPVEALHRAGLVWTPAKEKTYVLKGMRVIYESLTLWRPVEIMRRKYLPNHKGTPTDMQHAIVDFIEEHMREADK